MLLNKDIINELTSENFLLELALHPISIVNEVFKVYKIPFKAN